jgi:hypothetical protein
MSSLQLSLHVETLVLFPTLLLIAAILIQREKRNPLLLIVTFLGIAFLPAIADLRVGLGILASAFYYTSFELRKHQKLFLMLTGIFTGLTFTFGQEIAAILVILLLAGELFNDGLRTEWRTRLKYLLGGTVIGLLPLLIYVIIFSNVANFLYYTIWYSFIIQPKYMNLPFPGISYNNLIYYLPFALYWFCFLVLYANRKFAKPMALVLAFCILQLVSAFGRSDFDHLLFSIPELFVVVPLFLMSIKDSYFGPKTLRQFAPYGIALIALFALGKLSHSFTIILIPFVMLYAIDKRKREHEVPSINVQAKINVAILFGGLFMLFIFLLYPTYKSTVSGAVAGWHNRYNTTDEIEGVRADPITYEEVKGVEAQVQKDHPETIFSFPIIAFFDSLAPHHGSRYITFEFETTVTEQNKTIQDLEHSKPGVVVFDPLQAEILSPATWKISDYITAHYRVQKQISYSNIYWVMVPKANPQRDDKLVYQLYHDNTTTSAHSNLQGIQSSQQGLNYAIEQSSHQPMSFVVKDSKGVHLDVSLSNYLGTTNDPAACGSVEVSSLTVHLTKSFCSTDGETVLPIKPSKSQVKLTFINKTDSPIIWNNAEVTN